MPPPPLPELEPVREAMRAFVRDARSRFSTAHFREATDLDAAALSARGAVAEMRAVLEGARGLDPVFVAEALRQLDGIADTFVGMVTRETARRAFAH